MTLTFETMSRAACLAAAVLMLSACPDKENETEGGTETGTTGGSTAGSSTMDAPTTGGPTSGVTEGGGTMGGTMSGSTTGGPDSSTGGTMGGLTTTSEGTTAVTTDTSGTTTDTGDVIPPELDASCMSACDKFFECVDPAPFPDVDTCKAECADALGEGPMCLENTVAFNNCIGQMNCQELTDAFMNEQFGPCEDEFMAMGETCAACEGFGGAGPDGCSIGQQCPNQPLQEYLCEGDTCTCMVDNQPQGECPAAGFCDLEFGAQAEAAFQCCGFEF